MSEPPPPPTSPPAFDSTQLPSLVRAAVPSDGSSCTSGISHHTESEPPSPPPGVLSPEPRSPNALSVHSAHSSQAAPSSKVNEAAGAAHAGVPEGPSGGLQDPPQGLADQELTQRRPSEQSAGQEPVTSEPELQLPPPPVHASRAGSVSSKSSIRTSPSPIFLEAPRVLADEDLSVSSVTSAVPEAAPAAGVGARLHHNVDLRAPGAEDPLLAAASQFKMELPMPPVPPVRSEPPAPPPPPSEPIVGALPSTGQLQTLGEKISRHSISADDVRHVQGLLNSLKARGKPVTPVADPVDGASVARMLEPEEDLERAVVVQSEAKMREDLLRSAGSRMANSSQSCGDMSPVERKLRLERKREKKLRRLRELKQAEIHRAWQASRSQQRHDVQEIEKEEEKERVLESNKMTKTLRQQFKGSMPPFACNVHDLWDRGVIHPPEKQPREDSPIGDNKAYHELASGLRRAYWQQRIDREQVGREEEFRSSLSSRPSSADGLPYLSKTNTTTSAPGPSPTTFSSIVERFEYELAHGPTEDDDARAVSSKWRSSRQAWR